MTNQKDCRTCIHSDTHENCIGCLGEEGRKAPYEYKYWVLGYGPKRRHEYEIAGKRCIVIGGQGEADFYATDKPESVASHLRYVADTCGYLCGNIGKGSLPDEKTLEISTREGTFSLSWIKDVLQSITCVSGNGWSWSNC